MKQLFWDETTVGRSVRILCKVTTNKPGLEIVTL